MWEAMQAKEAQAEQNAALVASILAKMPVTVLTQEEKDEHAEVAQRLALSLAH